MDIPAMLNRVNKTYVLIGNVSAMGDELDRLALARQELRNLNRELVEAQKEVAMKDESVQKDGGSNGGHD